MGAPPAKKPKPKEIPVPQIGTVPTYTRDYLPTFRIPETYIRGKGEPVSIAPDGLHAAHSCLTPTLMSLGECRLAEVPMCNLCVCTERACVVCMRCRRHQLSV